MFHVKRKTLQKEKKFHVKHSFAQKRDGFT